MKYKASLDNWAAATTVITTAFLTIGEFLIITDIAKAPSYWPAMIPLIFFVPVFMFRPINYSLTANTVIIHRAIKDVVLDRKRIRSVELLNKKQIEIIYKIWGVSGFWGYFGRFSITKIGSSTWYATRRDKAVLIIMIDNKKIVVSPDKPERFVENCNL